LERSEFFQWAIIFGIYGWMIASDILFAGQVQIAGASKIVSMVLMVGAIAISDAYYTWAASKYVHIKMIIRPVDKIVHLFVDRGGEIDKAIYGVTNLFTSTLPLGFSTKIPDVPEKVSKVKIQHVCKFGDRVKPVKGKASYKSNIVDHNQTATISVRRVTMAYERGEIVPTFELESGNGDEEVERINGPILPMSIMMGNPKPDLVAALRLALKENRHVKRLVGVFKEQAASWHQDSIAKDGQIKSMTQELNAVHKDNPNVMTGAIRLAQALDRNEGDMQRLGRRGSLLARMPKWLGYVIVVAMVLAFGVYVTQQPDFWIWSSQGNTQWFIIGIIALIGILYYFGVYRRRGK